MKRVPWIAGGILLLAGAAWLGVCACGPDLTVADFDPPSVPDTAPPNYVAGKLGILRPGFSFQDRVIAYRWMKGLGLTAADQGAFLTHPKEEGIPDPKGWLAARSLVIKDDPTYKVDPYTQLTDWSSYPRLTQGALDTAAATLVDRLSVHGDGAEIHAWIAGQDRVFHSKAGDLSIPEPVSSPVWLKADRDYQIAAALFYAERFDEAREAFAAIGQDKASPWRPWGPYLEARCLVRKAMLAPKLPDEPVPKPEPGHPPYVVLTHPDPVPWKVAQARISSLLASGAGPQRNGLVALLDLVRHRTEPDALWRDDLQALATAKDGLAPVLDSAAWASFEKKGDGITMPDPAADLEAWLDVMGVNGGAKAGRPALAYDQWQAGGGTVWLAAAMALWPAPGPEADVMMMAAAKIPDSDPAAPTLRWNTLRLHLASLEGAEKRASLDVALKMNLPNWARNELLRQRGAAATNLRDWMRSAVHCVTGYGSDSDYSPSNTQLPSRLFDDIEAATLNRAFTIAQLREASAAPDLPAPLRDEIARVAWVRSVLLNRWDEASALAPTLEPVLKDRAMLLCAVQDSERRRFDLARFVMAFPGLRPYLRTGIGGFRGDDPVSEFNGIRDNWWCAGGTSWQMNHTARPVAVPDGPAFLKADEIKTAAAEQAALTKVPAAQAWFGRIVLDYAKTHPNDPEVPEALARVVATTQSPMCEGPEISAVSRDAFRMLHAAYKDTSAAKRTKFHY